jgi:hypothetical protein
VWWLNRDGGQGPDWRWGRKPFEQGAILGTFIGGPPPLCEDVTATLELRIDDREVSSRALPVVKTLTGTLHYIWNVVLPRVWHGY